MHELQYDVTVILTVDKGNNAQVVILNLRIVNKLNF